MKLPTRTEYSQQFHALNADDARGDLLIHVRPIAPDDEQRLIDFFRSHTAATIHLRYGMMMREMSHHRALQLVRLDGHTELALVALDGPPDAEFIVAVGRYFLDEATNLAEVAFVVHEEYRGLGLATHLLCQLTQIVRDKGFAGITAQVLESNAPMLQVFAAVLGCADQTTSGEGETTLIYRFKESAGKAAVSSLPDSKS